MAPGGAALGADPSLEMMTGCFEGASREHLASGTQTARNTLVGAKTRSSGAATASERASATSRGAKGSRASRKRDVAPPAAPRPKRRGTRAASQSTSSRPAVRGRAMRSHGAPCASDSDQDSEDDLDAELEAELEAELSKALAPSQPGARQPASAATRRVTRASARSNATTCADYAGLASPFPSVTSTPVHPGDALPTAPARAAAAKAPPEPAAPLEDPSVALARIGVSIEDSWWAPTVAKLSGQLPGIRSREAFVEVSGLYRDAHRVYSELQSALRKLKDHVRALRRVGDGGRAARHFGDAVRGPAGAMDAAQRRLFGALAALKRRCEAWQEAQR
ncbi:unnamed protein product [Pedinophyceae sp. YPF-701]|nr:unnamed protein product [Pedinophyceae sp. YPF-701]